MQQDSTIRDFTGKQKHLEFTSAIIATEVLSIIVCIVLLAGNLFSSAEKSRRRLVFTILLLTCIVACAADAISWLLDGRTQYLVAEYVSTTLSIILPFVLIGEFVAYLTVFIEERTEVSHLPFKLFTTFAVIAIVVTAVLCISGSLFSLQDGVYVSGPLYSVYVLVNIGSMVFAMAIVIYFHKYLDARERVVAFLYLLIPTFSAIINVFKDEYSFAYPATMISLLLIYVMIQSDTVDRLEHEGRVVSHHATHDELTGLRNRRAFFDRMMVLKGEEGMSGVIYGDLNGLKHKNDNFGHEAGDQLLVRFSELLAGVFRKDEIYRIGGDEFLCVLENISSEIFEARLDKLKAALSQDEECLACIGATFGKNQDIDDLIKAAEAEMYSEKDRFHKQYPEMKR